MLFLLKGRLFVHQWADIGIVHANANPQRFGGGDEPDAEIVIDGALNEYPVGAQAILP